MKKMLALVFVGVAAGAAIYLFKVRQPEPATLLVSAEDAQSVDVQKSLSALDRRVRELTAEVQSLKEASGKTATSPQDPAIAVEGRRRRGGDGTPFGEQPSEEQIKAMREQFQERENERIKAAGLTPERMTAINRRVEELRVAAMQAQYEAQRTGQRVDGTNIEQTLRKELGDAEYERYLKASGRPTEVRVMDVLATSAAEKSGLKAGDEIVSYNGKRVFDARDLNTLSQQSAAGSSVTVEVKRNGQTVQMSVPAGPLGVNAGGDRGGGPGGFGGPGGGGPPGGFGGGGFGGGRQGGGAGFPR
jgi:membrane-associated protease RseP (regulator of RpoE activity)